MTKKITEQELLEKVAKLYENMDQSVEEGWWGDNMPEFLGGDPAKAPMKLPVTPKNYARVQKMLPAMYQAAQVDPNADDIIKQRFGLYLPPFEKWDGTVPSGHGDFLTRNVLGRSGAAAGEAEGAKAQQAEVERQQRVEANAKKLTDLYAKLKELLPAAFEEKPAEPAAAVATPVKESLAESMKRLSLMLAEQAEPAAEPEAAPAGSGHPAEAVIKEINDTIAAIEADDPDEEDEKMLAAVKEKVAQCQTIIKQEAEKAPVTPADVTNPDEAEKAKEVAQAEREKQIGAAQDGVDAAGGDNATPGTTQKPTFPWSQLYDMNKSIIGNNPNLIKPGQVFELPNGAGKYTVVPGDTLSGIAAGQGKGQYATNVPPQAPKPPVPPQPQLTPKAITPPFQKEPPDFIKNPPAMGQYHKVGGEGTFNKSMPGNHLDVSDPKIKAMQAKADADPNGVSYKTTVREDQSLARLVNLVNYGK